MSHSHLCVDPIHDDEDATTLQAPLIATQQVCEVTVEATSPNMATEVHCIATEGIVTTVGRSATTEVHCAVQPQAPQNEKTGDPKIPSAEHAEPAMPADSSQEPVATPSHMDMTQ